MCRSGSIAKSQMLTEIKKNVAIAKARILVESDTVKHLQTLTAFSSEMPLLDDILVVCRCVLKKKSHLYFHELNIFSQIFMSKVFRSVALAYEGLFWQWLMNSIYNFY